MYNKPITQRVAFARGKKASALKQTEDTTVLNTEIPIVKETAIVDLPDTTTKTTVKKEGKVIEASKERCGIEVPMDDPRCVAYSKMTQEEIKASEIKQGLRTPDTEEEIETVVPGGKGEAEVPLYQYDYGDSMPSWMQRKVYRGLKVGERQQKKALKSQLKEGAITKEEYKQGLTNAATKRANAAKDFATTQAEAAEQGQMFGKTGTTRISTFDPNRSVSGEGPVAREMTAADDTEQRLNAKEEAIKLASVQAAKNRDDVNKRNAQESTQTTDVISTTAKPTENEDTAVKMRNFGPLKMKSSFKMGGYGNKTYKK
jgi:hypothetical protein